MSKTRVSYETTLMVRETCLCLGVQQVARALARHFDEALRPLDLTNGQYSLLMSLNQPELPTISAVANLLSLDRTTLTAALKPLERRRLITIKADPDDKRSRRLALTEAGHALLSRALPIWKKYHGRLEKHLGAQHADRLCADLRFLTRVL
jgi:DNA-binding MarR family transcriptional regulator